MARYAHLPIYKTTYQLLLESTHVIKRFPRDYKYTLGQKIREEITEIIVLVYRANSTKDKKPYVEELLSRLQVVNVLIRLTHDLKIIPVKKYAGLAEKTDSIGKQASGWLKNVAAG